MEGGVLPVHLPAVWDEVGTVGVFKGYEGTGYVLEKEWDKRPPLPGRFLLHKEGEAGLPAVMLPVEEGLLLNRTDHQHTEMLFDTFVGATPARLRCRHGGGQVPGSR